MRRLLTGLAVAALLVVGAAYLGRNSIVRHALEIGVRRQTGFPLEVGAVEVGIFAGSLDAHSLRLLNPPDFPERTFVELPSLHVECDPLSLVRRAPHLRELAVDVKEVRIVSNGMGERNSTRLASAVGGGARPPGRVHYRVDVLRVHVGTIVIEDFSRGQHTQRRLVLDSSVTYRDLSESTNLSRLVLSSVLGQIGPAIGDTARAVGDKLRDTGPRVRQAGKAVLDLFRRRR